jgi:hypothetical protein
MRGLPPITYQTILFLSGSFPWARAQLILYNSFTIRLLRASGFILCSINQPLGRLHRARISTRIHVFRFPGDLLRIPSSQDARIWVLDS